MQHVISFGEAKQITKGRTPLVPIQYEEAINSLAACLNLEDAKVWSDKADALAAWAKIYRDDKISRQARQLKLHAYRRMGQLAMELRPPSLPRKVGVGSPGPRSLLIEQGLNSTQANAAHKLGKISDGKFSRVVNRPHPPSPAAAAIMVTRDASQSWIDITTYPGASIYSFRSFCRKFKARELALGLREDERMKVAEITSEIVEWLDEFDRTLAK